MADLTRKTANLFPVSSFTGKSYTVLNNFNSASETIEFLPNTQYTISLDFSSTLQTGIFKITFVYTDETSSSSDWLYGTTHRTLTSNAGKTVSSISLTDYAQYVDVAISDIMLNSGSTAKPYEPYGWVHSLRKLTTATEAVVNPLYSDGTAITSYTIKGNTVQNGTPTPSNPVSVNGVGERTTNLFNVATTTDGYEIHYGNITPNADWCVSDYIPVEVGQTYYGTNTGGSVILYDAQKSNSRSVTGLNNAGIATVSGDAYMRINMSIANKNTAIVSTEGKNIPYEPWGFKIPILTSQGSTVNYLGSVQSTRQIKKYIFDGTEDWQLYNGNFFSRVTDEDSETNTQVICSHFPSSNTAGIYIGSGGSRLKLFSSAISGISTVNELKDWITSEYTNGTPLTIWYVLSADNVGLINEPLMNLHSVIGTKIVDCADSISNATAIPTTDGANTITVDTTVQPSEFSATWTGWHDSTVKEWDGSQWQ